MNTARRAWLASLPLSPRAQIVFAFDLAAAALCWLLAFALRFNFEVPPDYLALALGSLIWVVPLHACVFVLAGLYRGLWRFASLNDLRRLAVAGVAAGAGIALIAYLKQAELPIPRSVVVLAPLLLVLLMGGARRLPQLDRLAPEQRRVRSPAPHHHRRRRGSGLAVAHARGVARVAGCRAAGRRPDAARPRALWASRRCRTRVRW
ncbi:MAG: hypothetical protein ACK54C_07890 [Betaproteobacteria bacterium]